MKKSLMCTSLILMFLLTSCNDAVEPEALGYVVAIGIDKASDNQDGYNITIQYANPNKISGGSEESGGKGGSESINNIMVEASGIYSAINIANHIISKKFVLSHTKLIVFSDEIAKSGIENFLEAIGRSSDIRPNTYLAVSKGSAEEFLKAVNPESEVNPVRYYTMIFENDYSGFIPQQQSRDFYFYYDSLEKDVVMPLCSVKKEEKGNKEENFEGYQIGQENYVAGQINTKSEETQVLGSAVFDGDIKVSELSDVDTEILNMLMGKYKSSYVSYKFSKTPDTPITVLEEQKRKPKIKVKIGKEGIKADIKVFLEADFSSGTAREIVENHLDEFTDEAAEEIKLKILEVLEKTKELNLDLVGFGSFAKRNFLTLKDFEDFKWKEKYKNIEFDVSVVFEIKRTGLIVRSE